MRLGWTTSKYSVTYRAVKTVRINGKNKTLIVKSFGSEKYICETYGVTDAKAWAKEQVRLMNEAEKEDTAKFTIELCLTKLFLRDSFFFFGVSVVSTEIFSLSGYEFKSISGLYVFSGLRQLQISFSESFRPQYLQNAIKNPPFL